ncbi:MAG: hypothetical protein CM1200mP12_05790 [Gammaproteobacteria bacterium]|nr:MAG: hypothetical protein CM1200mP12_05790 [Gammaproteobacteria bacterium]
MVISNRELGFGGNMSDIIASESTNYDLNEVVASLNRLLKLRTIPIGMKMFESIEEMESIPKIRRPSAVTRQIRLWVKLVETVGLWE